MPIQVVTLVLLGHIARSLKRLPVRSNTVFNVLQTPMKSRFRENLPRAEVAGQICLSGSLGHSNYTYRVCLCKKKMNAAAALAPAS
jgi:hypothetical protein